MSDPFDAVVPGDHPAESLRLWGEAHPAVAFVLGSLPDATDEAAQVGVALVVERVQSAWSAGKGELNVGLVRVFVRTPDGAHLVGQLQGSERGTIAGHKQRRLRAVLHEPGSIIAREAHDLESWWLAVLERFYACGGAPLDLDDHAPVGR